MAAFSPYSGCIRVAQRASRVTRTAPIRDYSSAVTSQTDIDNEARRLVRALLRECSYLPDSLARTRIKHQILSRFGRRARNNTKIFKRRDLLSSSECDPIQPAAKNIIDSGFKKAYKALRQLQAANNGEIVQLDKVLRLAYGRTGPYRRDLLAPLLRADPLDDSELLGQQIRQQQGPLKSEWTIDTVRVDKVFQQPPMVGMDTVVYVISPEYSKFKALAESQVQARPPAMRGVELKRVDFKMPAKNAWDRMMPRLRVKNMVHRAYANLLDKILPPLNEVEWKRLHGLVHGNIKGEGSRPRRRKITAKQGILTSCDLEQLAHLDIASSTALSTRRGDEETWLNNADTVEEAKEDLLRDELSLGRPLNRRAKRKATGHQLTPRFMQRMWQRIFEACPMLTWDDKRREWHVTWGYGPETLDKPQSNDDLAPLFGALKESSAEQQKSRKVLDLNLLRKNDMRKPQQATLA